MLGNFHDNVINIECETNSADIYVVDEEGTYIENIALHSYLESDVIDAINAKYGTNFTHLTMQKVTDIAIGDDCPNWNAYEKIELPSFYAKTKVNNNTYIARVEHGVVNAIGEMINNNWYCTVVDDNGVCQPLVTGGGIIEGLWVPRLQNYGVQVTAGTFIDLGYRKDDIIPNFSEYIEIPA